MEIYEGDSFHTLTALGQIGLVLLSTALSAALLWIGWRVMAGRPFALRIVLALVLFFGFVWLSPQVYYTYYMTLFEGLPWQSVIKSPPGAERLLRLFGFQGPQNMAAHSQGVLGWALVVMAVLRRRAAKGTPPDDPA